MFSGICRLLVVLLCVSLMTGIAGAATGLEKGTPDIKAAGPLAFGPGGVLFVGDSQSAAVFAVDTGDAPDKREPADINVKGLDKKIANLLGTSADQVQVNDVAVNPLSGNAYLSVARGKGPKAQPAILKVSSDGKISAVSLKDVPFAKAALPNPPADKVTGKGRRARNKRRDSITDLAFFDGRLYIAGLSNEDFASKLRSIPFPFADADAGTSVEIYHASHGKLETRSPVRTFVPLVVGGEPHLLAAYTCTPLVTFPISRLTPDTKVTGTTVAELGNRNRPLDMIVYEQDGKRYVLMANNNRGVMKFTTEGIDKAEGLKERVRDKAGHPYETIEGLTGVVQLDRLDDSSALVLVQDKRDNLNLQTIPLP